MAKSFTLTIATPDGIQFTGDVSSVRIPSSEGSFGVLANHAPLIATLGAGRLQYRSLMGDEHAGMIAGGVVEVLRNRVTLFTSRWAVGAAAGETSSRGV